MNQQINQTCTGETIQREGGRREGRGQREKERERESTGETIQTGGGRGEGRGQRGEGGDQVSLIASGGMTVSA